LRVAFAGTPEFARPALEALLAQHEVVGVLTQPDRPSGRGRHLTRSPVKALATARGLPLSQPQSLDEEDARAPLVAWAPEALVVVAYGLKLPAAVLALPHFGCINIHASLLPRWRGAAPVQRAILAGDAVTGVTIMAMDEGLDTGPILLQRRLPIGERDTAGSLLTSLANLGAAALIEALAGIAAGTLARRAQPSEGACYAKRIDKAEARIDWALDATAIERQVRAFNPWPIAETRLEGQQLRIHAARAFPDLDSAPNMLSIAEKSRDPGDIVAVRDGIMLVQCGQGLLAVLEVQRPGGRVLQVRDFSHSLELVGRRLG
jgi:methionyl-tRNA formyltransferase